MSWINNTFNSTLGKKLLTALTGLFLISFLVVHLLGNLQLFNHDGGYAFNKYAAFMTTNPIIKFTSYFLYASILGHAFLGIALTLKNKKARPVGYAVNDNRSAWNSRNMGILGTIILAFVVFHMMDFWREYKFEDEMPYKKYTLVDGVYNVSDASTEEIAKWTAAKNETGSKVYTSYESGTEVVILKDLFEEVNEAFESIVYVLLYVLSMAAIAFHLHHGFASAFQTLGFNHKKYTPIIKAIGVAYSIIIPLVYAAIPVVKFING